MNDTANLVDWIENIAQGEPIEAVVIGGLGRRPWDEQIRNRPLTWAQARPLLDYTFDSGYGAPGCNAIYAWTPTKIIGISQYDGSTSPFWIPRNPIDCEPTMPGGG